MIGSLLAIIRKDFKLLFRSKSSTMAVLLGPLLIILLVGLVFTNAGEPELIIGVVEEDFENIDLYTRSLEDAFIVNEYDSKLECSGDVKQGKIASCVSFEDAIPPKARIYVDTTDVNVVYAVIDRITGEIENQSSVLRSGFAEQLINTLGKTSIKLQADEEQIREAQLLVEKQVDKVDEMVSTLKDIQIEVSFVSKDQVADAIEASITARDDYKQLLELVLVDYQDYVDAANLDDENETKDEIGEYYEEFDFIGEDNDEAEDVFTELLSGVDELKTEIEDSETSAQAHVSQARQVKNSLTKADENLKDVIKSVSSVGEQIGAVDVSRTDIENPVEPIIEPIVSSQDDFGFVFPFFIMLIVMFTSILLASSIVVKERSSSAYFRNFTTPTPEWVFVISNYVTTSIILALQVIIIYAVANFLISFSLVSTLLTAFFVLWASITVFTFLGMLLGYIFKTHEGVMLAAISVSSVMLFVSNLVLPTETIPAALKAIVNANPLVILSEMLKATIIFNFGFRELLSSFLVIMFYSIILFAAIMIVQRIARIRYFEVSGSAEKISEFLGKQEIPEGKELQLGRYKVASKIELINVLKKMSDDTYEKFCTHRHNKIADWIKDIYKDDRLANLLKNKSRKGAINVLEKEIKKDI